MRTELLDMVSEGELEDIIRYSYRADPTETLCLLHKLVHEFDRQYRRRGEEVKGR